MGVFLDAISAAGNTTQNQKAKVWNLCRVCRGAGAKSKQFRRQAMKFSSKEGIIGFFYIVKELCLVKFCIVWLQ